MSTYYYFHLDLNDALEWVGVSGCFVFYYVPEMGDPEPWTDTVKVPDDAESVVVATTDDEFDHGTYIDEVSYAGGKDPVPDPPPPPPAFWDDLVDYKKLKEVDVFFHSGTRAFKVA